MTRARTLSYVLWSIAAAGCSSDDNRVGHLPDAPPSDPDAPSGNPVLAVGAIPNMSTTCGITPDATDVPIMNTGDAALVISAFATGGFVIVTPLPLTVAVGAQATVSVRAPLAVIGTDRGGQIKTGKLTVTTNEATPIHTIDLSATVQGANLVFTDQDAMPIASITMSGASGACPAPVAVFLRNTGTLPITVGEASASGFGFSGFTTGEIAPGSSEQQQIRVKTMGICAADVDIAYAVTGTVCTMPTVKLAATFLIDPPGSLCTCL
jgi:hypothetical protein